MAWYTASLIVALRRTDKQGPITVFENFVLVEANGVDEAMDFAKEYGVRSNVSDPSLTLDGFPAEENFVGIRKLIEISNPFPGKQIDDPPRSGTEVSYSRYEIRSDEELAKLVGGDSVKIEYHE